MSMPGGDAPQGELLAVFLTVKVDTATLNNWLTSSYSQVSNSSKSLCVLSSDAKPNANIKVSLPPITEITAFPFEGKDVQTLSQWLNQNYSKTPITNGYFFVVDKQSISTNSLLFVQVIKTQPAALIRLYQDQISAASTSIILGTLGIDEAQELAGSDGIYRG